jgi:hypothetical protein
MKYYGTRKQNLLGIFTRPLMVKPSLDLAKKKSIIKLNSRQINSKLPKSIFLRNFNNFF